MSVTLKKPVRISTTAAEMQEAIKIGRERDRTATKIVAASYERGRDAIVVELSTGAILSVPKSAIPGFAKATPSAFADLEITAGREGLWSDSIDDGVLLEQLIVIAAGKEIVGFLGAQINASKTSPARASASRANGLKGGRPRLKKTTAA